MKKSDYVLKSLINAAGVFVYVSAVGWFGFHSKEIFGGDSNFLIPVFALLLFVISACITGLLVLGKPILMYFGGLKKEAFMLFFSTLAWLIFFLIAVAIVLAAQ